MYPRVSVSAAGYLNTRTMPPQGAACQKILMNYTHYKWERGTPFGSLLFPGFLPFPGTSILSLAICLHFCLHFWTTEKRKTKTKYKTGSAELTMKWFKQCFAILRFTPVWVQTINIECRKYILMAMVSNLNLFSPHSPFSSRLFRTPRELTNISSRIFPRKFLRHDLMSTSV